MNSPHVYNLSHWLRFHFPLVMISIFIFQLFVSLSLFWSLLAALTWSLPLLTPLERESRQFVLLNCSIVLRQSVLNSCCLPRLQQIRFWKIIDETISTVVWRLGCSYHVRDPCRSGCCSVAQHLPWTMDLNTLSWSFRLSMHDLRHHAEFEFIFYCILD